MSQVAVGITLFAFAAFAALGGGLAWIDVRTHRLPDRIVLPATAGALVCAAGAALASGDPWLFPRVCAGGAGLLVFYLALALATRGGIGGGDVKLAGLVGAMLAWSSWESLLAGTISAFVLGGVAAAVLLLSRRRTREARIAFGPWMLAGAWLGILYELRESGALGL